VQCLNAENNCSDKIALNIYKANEDLLNKYSELKDHKLTSRKIYERPFNNLVIVDILTNNKNSQYSMVSYMVS